ncbi:serine/threonine-protein kinase [Hyalangium versicolor]|uniref:serine/threonine-protein kinase n=1 Tax=Hyalangium versicolor TaxID=2861190 RepID=UPI001CCF45F4|nr:serine/threonine-protein kinase [Hyalangium versicolor]
MQDAREEQLEVALKKGFISPAEVEALRKESHARARSPLQLLHERGLISEETLNGLQQDLLETSVVQRANPSEADTLPPAGTAHGHGTPAAGAFPVPGWERYQFVRLLGEGGMGQVFLSYDPRLRRNVALKFVRGQGPELVSRLISEARAQARVDHESVCHVHEVGEVQGLPYIAMQHVNGHPLSSFTDTLTVTQKAMVVRDAALGIHAAHGVGLIHRDIKPSNILVEQTPEGRLRPYVLDFGLARDWRSKGLTETGAVLGTPHFMAPEQARGEVTRLDWRADVYSLGATFYHLLTGKLSVPGENALEVLNKIATTEPRPPRSIDPRIPQDLEAIVLKCLEKERSARYDSMLALIEDLDRFLAGEPVKARSAGLGYQLYKKARKHRRMVAVAAAALLAVAGALGWAVYTRSQAARLQVFTRDITEKVERIESLARLTALSPIHDTRTLRDTLLREVSALEKDSQEAGPLAEGAVRYGQGRAYLALDEDRKALEKLEAAWAAGFQEPRVAFALAQVMSRLYRQERLEAARLAVQRGQTGQPASPPHQRIESRYRQGATAYLKLSEKADDFSPVWGGALIAFYDEDFDEALKQLDSMKASEPWRYEALQLRGDILQARAARHVETGDFEKARQDFADGREAYAAAAEIGRSELAIPLAQAELELTQLIMEIHHKGHTEECFQRGMDAVARALRIAPDSVEALLLEAQLGQRMAEHKLNSRAYAEASALVDSALTAATKADAQSSHAHLELAQILILQGRILAQKNESPNAPLAQALELLNQVQPKDRDAHYMLQRGLLFASWAEDTNTPGSTASHLDQAIEAFHQATVLDDKLRPAWTNLAKNYLERERRQDAKAPEEDLQRAQEAIERAMALGAQDHVVHHYAGQVHARKAARILARGDDARAEWNNARAVYEDAIRINAQESYLHDDLGAVLNELAREEWRHAGDPSQFLTQAQASYEKAYALNRQFTTALNNVSDTWMLRALYEQERGTSPETSLKRALAALTLVSQLDPTDPVLQANLGAVHVLSADFESSRGRDPSQSLRLAEDALRSAMAGSQDDPQIWRYRGQLRGLQARWLSRHGKSRDLDQDFAQAASDFQRALELAGRTYDTRKTEYLMAFARFCCEWSTWQRGEGESAKEAQKLGLETLQATLKVSPQMLGALELRQCLHETEFSLHAP